MALQLALTFALALAAQIGAETASSTVAQLALGAQAGAEPQTTSSTEAQRALPARTGAEPQTASSTVAQLALPAQTSAETETASSTVAQFVPPRAIDAPPIKYPVTATTAAEVTVRMTVDERGEVIRVELVVGAGAPFDEAVLIGVTHFVFEPGRYGGQPVPVQINFTQRFVPPPRELPPELPPTGVLAGRIEQRGTRRPVATATVSVEVNGVEHSALSDAEGRFEVEVRAGTATVTITHYDHLGFRQHVKIEADQRVTVGYLLQQGGSTPYEVVVRDRLDAEVISTTRLRDREIKQVPGTFGDPFRVIATLPGVSQVSSLLPFPVVRGSSPGNTGFLIDGVRVPLLFHLLAGPSVLNAVFIDEIEFSPGGFPVEYGGYTGGIVDGKTRAARPDEETYELDLNLFQVGGLARIPLPALDGTATFAARYGYPGFLISLADPRTTLSYWDYQARFDGGTERSGYSVFLFGASDSLSRVPTGEPDDAEKESYLNFAFHRVDLSYHHKSDRLSGEYRLALGYDNTLVQDADSLQSFSATPRLRWSYSLFESLELRAGFDGLARTSEVDSEDPSLGAITDLLGGSGGLPSSILYSGGVLVEALIRPSERLVIRPGVRADLYHNTEASLVGVDPRVLARYQLFDAPRLWIKGGVGLYHQPPRFTIPLPGLDQIAFSRGLLEAVQTSAGAELELSDGWSFDGQVYFNWMDPILFDVNINPDVDEISTQPPTGPPGQIPPTLPVDVDGPQDRADRLLVAATGRSIGFEALLRRRSTSGVSGWLSYTFSRSDRLREEGWTAFDFDRTHILNAVASIPLPRDWHLGLRGQLQTGRPITTTEGAATARTASFVRFDLRVDKVVTWNDWLLIFYVDVANVALASEELATEARVRYVLPALGFRAIF